MAHHTTVPYLDQTNIPIFLMRLSDKIAMRYGRQTRVKLLIVGGSALALKYQLRGTVDIDGYTSFGRNITSLVVEIANECSIETDWLNYDFAYTESFSRRLEDDAIYYNTYSDILDVYVVSDLSQLCMKVTAWRRKDMSDIDYLVRVLVINGYSFTDFVEKFFYLYGDNVVLKNTARHKVEALFRKYLKIR